MTCKLPGICFWGKGRGKSGWAKYMGDQGECQIVWLNSRNKVAIHQSDFVLAHDFFLEILIISLMIYVWFPKA